MGEDTTSTKPAEQGSIIYDARRQQWIFQVKQVKTPITTPPDRLKNFKPYYTHE